MVSGNGNPWMSVRVAGKSYNGFILIDIGGDGK